MAYGDITGSPHSYRAPSLPGVQTVRKAVVLKDASTIGSAAINYLDNTKDFFSVGMFSDKTSHMFSFAV